MKDGVAMEGVDTQKVEVAHTAANIATTTKMGKSISSGQILDFWFIIIEECTLAENVQAQLRVIDWLNGTFHVDYWDPSTDNGRGNLS